MIRKMTAMLLTIVMIIALLPTNILATVGEDVPTVTEMPETSETSEIPEIPEITEMPETSDALGTPEEDLKDSVLEEFEVEADKQEDIHPIDQDNLLSAVMTFGDTEEEEPLETPTPTPEPEVLGKEGEARIHYIGLDSDTDAILIESNGRFGMIDAGEDWDYPDNSDPRYPFRSGTTVSIGYDMQVIHYLESVGVNSSNFDFFIGTHAHSDHLGVGDDIVRIFKPTTVYLKRYSDNNVSNINLLWDTRYVYDQFIEAVNKTDGVKLVQDIEEESIIELGDLTLQFFNTAVRRPVNCENANSLVIKAIINEQTTLLTGDAEGWVLEELLEAGKIGKVEILKLSHHGSVNENQASFLREIAPKEAILTGFRRNLNNSTKNVLEELGTSVYATTEGVAAYITSYTTAGYTTSPQMVAGGWWSFEGHKYYIMSNGACASGWLKVDGNHYYFRPGTDKYAMMTDWQKIGSYWYYMKPTGEDKGKMVTGWQTIGGEDYYFGAPGDGKMVTGWKLIDGSWYYLGANNGRLLTGWQWLDNGWYYLDQDQNGMMQTGWQKVDGIWYYLNPSGVMQTDWLLTGGEWYYLNQSGAMQTGWLLTGGEWYYLNQSGAMQIGWLLTGGEWYYLTSSGAMQTGWLLTGGKWYYLNPSGAMRTDWLLVGGEWYYFNLSGAMQSEWQLIGGHWYYLSSAASGKMVTRRQLINGVWYNFNNSGRYIA